MTTSDNIAMNFYFDFHLRLIIDHVSYLHVSVALFGATYAGAEEISIKNVRNLANEGGSTSDFVDICGRQYRLVLQRSQNIFITLERRNNLGSHYKTLKVDIHGKSGQLVSVYETDNGVIPTAAPTSLTPKSINDDIDIASDGSATGKIIATWTEKVKNINKSFN